MVKKLYCNSKTNNMRFMNKIRFMTLTKYVDIKKKSLILLKIHV